MENLGNQKYLPLPTVSDKHIIVEDQNAQIKTIESIDRQASLSKQQFQFQHQHSGMLLSQQFDFENDEMEDDHKPDENSNTKKAKKRKKVAHRKRPSLIYNLEKNADQIDRYFREKAKSKRSAASRSPRHMPQQRQVSTPPMVKRQKEREDKRAQELHERWLQIQSQQQEQKKVQKVDFSRLEELSQPNPSKKIERKQQLQKERWRVALMPNSNHEVEKIHGLKLRQQKMDDNMRRDIRSHTGMNIKGKLSEASPSDTMRSQLQNTQIPFKDQFRELAWKTNDSRENLSDSGSNTDSEFKNSKDYIPQRRYRSPRDRIQETDAKADANLIKSLKFQFQDMQQVGRATLQPSTRKNHLNNTSGFNFDKKDFSIETVDERQSQPTWNVVKDQSLSPRKSTQVQRVNQEKIKENIILNETQKQISQIGLNLQSYKQQSKSRTRLQISPKKSEKSPSPHEQQMLEDKLKTSIKNLTSNKYEYPTARKPEHIEEFPFKPTLIPRIDRDQQMTNLKNKGSKFTLSDYEPTKNLNHRMLQRGSSKYIIKAPPRQSTRKIILNPKNSTPSIKKNSPKASPLQSSKSTPKNTPKTGTGPKSHRNLTLNLGKMSSKLNVLTKLSQRNLIVPPSEPKDEQKSLKSKKKSMRLSNMKIVEPSSSGFVSSDNLSSDSKSDTFQSIKEESQNDIEIAKEEEKLQEAEKIDFAFTKAKTVVDESKKVVDQKENLSKTQAIKPVPMADLLKPEIQVNQDKIVPEKPRVKELTAQELLERYQHDCTDLFLFIDDTNVNYLTWDQIFKLFKEKNLLGDELLDTSEGPADEAKMRR